MSNPISFSLQIVDDRWVYPPVVDYRWCSGQTGSYCAREHISPAIRSFIDLLALEFRA
jgi:hypothetical protein